MTNEKKATLQGGFSENTHRYSSNTAPVNSINEVIIGEKQAEALIRSLKTRYVPSDALFKQVPELASSSPRLRGFCRASQKLIERVER